jgi:hypothetical protein
MFKYIIVVLGILFFNLQVIGEYSDSTSYYKRELNQNYTELDSNFKNEIRNSNWKLVASFNRKFLMFRKFESISSAYIISFFESTVCVKYGSNSSELRSYTVNFDFDNITPDFVIFKLDEESYVYQILRIENGYLIVNEYYINRKGRLKNSHKRLLFKNI